MSACVSRGWTGDAGRFGRAGTLPSLSPLLVFLRRSPSTPHTHTAFALRQQWSYWGYPYLKGWSNTTSPCGGGWEGVECDAGGRVTSLSLAARDLGGSLTPSLSAMTHLKTLNLSNNRVGAGLPEAWAGKMPALTTLALSNCTLIGAIPPSWAKSGAMPNLTVLDASLNTLSGGLPAGLADGAPKLAALALARNNLTGPLPASWGANGSFSSLEVLNLDDNKLGGGLPDAWAGLKAAKAVSLANTGVGGPLPASWAKDGALPALQVLNLAGNKLEGGLAPWATRAAFPKARGSDKGVILSPGNPSLKDARIPDGTPFLVLKALGGGRYTPCGSLPDCGAGAKDARAGEVDAPRQTLTATLELDGLDAANVTKAQQAAIAAAVSKALNKTSAKAVNVSVLGVAPLADAPALPDVVAVAKTGGRKLLQAAAPAPAAATAAPAAAAAAAPAPAAATTPSSSSSKGAQVRVAMDADKGDVDGILKALRAAAKDGSLLADLKAAGVPAAALALGSSQAARDATSRGASSGSRGLSGGAIAGIVIGVLLGLALLAALAWWLVTRHASTIGASTDPMLKTNAAYGGAGGDRSDPVAAKEDKKESKKAAKESAAAAVPAKKEGVVPYSEYRRQRLAGAAAHAVDDSPFAKK